MYQKRLVFMFYIVVSKLNMLEVPGQEISNKGSSNN